MVKAVVGEESQLKLAEDRLSQSGVLSEVGLVVGNLSSGLDRGFVFDLVPTPRNDAGEPASLFIDTTRDNEKKGSKRRPQAEASSLVIDHDWVAEHGRQVSRMLLGGMKVIGLYVWASDNSFKNSTATLCQTVRGVAEAASFSSMTDSDQKLIIHISYSPRRWTCRSCILTSNISSSSLCPCDFKMGKVLKSLQTFKSVYNFDIRLPIYHEASTDLKTFADFLRRAISSLAKELSGAKAVIGGNLVLESEPCSSDDLHEVEFLLPFTGDMPAGVCSEREVVGVLAFSGSLCSFAYANSREKISRAIFDIKEDIIKSLQTRLDILCDVDEEDMGPASNDISTKNPTPQLVLRSLRKPCCLSFPRRVFVPWLVGTYICDYIQSSESLEVVKEHCVELLSMEAVADVSTVLQPEANAPAMAIGSFWDAAGSTKASTIDRSERGSASMFARLADFNLVFAVLILLASLVAAWLLVFIK